MSHIVHIIDAATPADAVEQMLAERRDGQPVISVGPPPTHTALPDVRCIHRPLGQTAMAGRSLRRALPTGATAHAWSIEAAEAASYAGVAVVLTLSETTDLHALQPLPWSLARLGCQSIRTATDRMRDALTAAGLDRKHITVAPPTVLPPDQPAAVRNRIRHELGIPAEATVFVAPAEMTRTARHKQVCWAHAICGHAGEQPHLILPGGGEQWRAVRYFSETTGFDSLVHFTADRFSRRDAIAAADVAVFADEAPAGAAILACVPAAGLPCIATAAADPSDLLGTHAVRIHDSHPQTLSRALLAMMDNTRQPVQCASNSGSS